MIKSIITLNKGSKKTHKSHVMIIEAVTLAQIIKPKEIIPQPKPQQTVKVVKKKETKPKKIYYTVKKDDTIVKISKRFKVPVSRVLCANKQLDNPDLIHPSERLKIPHKKDKLKCAKIKTHFVNDLTSKPPINSGGFSDSGNMYANDMTPGYCTFWAKSQRPDLPTGLGNANTWYSRASAWGLPVGSTPRVGAVATTTRGAEGHVSIVEKIKGSQIYVSEMNVQGWNVLSYAWYPSGDYLYIY
jgi:surface antigen